MQNDDWNRTTSVGRFLTGDFTLIQKTATTFYTQGFIGLLFSLILGIKKLPFLTLLFSVLNLLIFARIIFKNFKFGKIVSIFLSFLLFFTPLHMYSMIGFMTENYTLFFMLLAIYFFLEYERNKKKINFALFNISGLLSFFTKQNGIIFNIGAIFYFLFKKRYKEAVIQTLFCISLFLYYFFLFPKTQEMQNKGFTVENFADIQYAYSLIYGIILVTVSFILPVVFYFISKVICNNKKSEMKIMLIAVVSILCFVYLNKIFVPGKISWEEYPYFENTFERTGFFPRSILGTKYYFRWNYDIYRYWDLAAKIALSLAIPCLLFERKKLVNIYSISIAGYLVLMVFTQVFFDRYILPLIPLLILFFLNLIKDDNNVIIAKRILSILLIPFIFFTLFLSSEMAIDFVLSNNYVWSKSESLVKEGILPDDIRSTMAWYKIYGLKENPRYMFSFSSSKVESMYLRLYNLEEEKNLSFKGSIFVDPKIYLYKRK